MHRESCSSKIPDLTAGGAIGCDRWQIIYYSLYSFRYTGEASTKISVRGIVMVAIVTSTLTFEEFLAWDDGSGREFELVNGVAMPLSEPNAKHEDVVNGLCQLIVQHCRSHSLPYAPRQGKQIRLFSPPLETQSSRKADIVVFAKDEWNRMRQLSASAAAYSAPPLAIEVVSTNWRDDYRIKLNEYEALGIPEYWIVDYAGLGGIQYIGTPKQPMLTIHQLVNGEYLPQQYRSSELLRSPTFPNLQLTLEEIIAMTID